jgi:flagellar P-ring protein precursor FlgI
VVLRKIVHAVVMVLMVSMSAFSDTSIKDISSIAGVRKNQLIGYGIVVGLNGTGDQNMPVTTQAAANMLKNLGITVPNSALRLKNVASVLVTADLPPFAKPGSTIDVTVSSMGDASSLQGGLLVMTTLSAANGEIYAVAQGSMVIGSGTAQARDAHKTVAYIPAGATVEKEVPFELINKEANTFDIVLAKPDFTTAASVAKAINQKFGVGTATAISPGAVRVAVKDDWKDMVSIWSDIETLPVSVDVPAKIIVNERTGTVVMGGNVRVLPAALSYGSLSVSISNSPSVVSTQGTKEKVLQERVVSLPQEGTVGDLVKVLNTLGAAPKDIVGILIALKDSGALLAELETM